MKTQCIAAVEAAIGRALAKSEADGIEGRVRAAMKQAAIADPQAFASMSVQSRLIAGAQSAALSIKEEAANAKRQAVAAIATHDRIGREMDEMTRGGMDHQDAVDRLLYENADGRGTVMSLETRIKATTEDYRRRMVNSFDALGPTMLGLFGNVKGAHDFTMEMFGKDSGNADAKKAAAEWRDLTDAMTAHFRDAGGVLHRLADWRFPQHHDQTRVFRGGRDAWVASVFDKLDRRRYVNEHGRLMDDGEVRALLENAWETISSGGANKMTPGDRNGSTSIANRELEHRVIHFKDAEGYNAYQQQYGGKDVWSTLTGHVDHMARSIGLMEHLGPNADREFAYWNDWATLNASKTKQNPQAAAAKLEAGYRSLAGYSEGVTNPTVARIFDDTRNVLVAARLGSAILSSVPDLATMAMTARYNRIGALESIWNGVRAMSPGNAEGRRELQRMGLMVNSQLQAIRRYQVDSMGGSWSSRMANAVLGASGLNHWTDGLRAGFATTQAHALAGLVADSPTLNMMDAADAKLLRAKGVTDVDYQVWRLARADDTPFGALLTPDSIYRIPDAALAAVQLPAVTGVTVSPQQLRREAVIKLLGVSLSETHMAVIEPGAKQRMQMGTSQPRGDLKGELLRSFWQFKTFPWALFQKHMVERGWGANDTVGGKLAYIVPMIIASTALGALAMTIKDLVLGKDPRPLIGADGKVLAKNWIAAFLQGGAFGMYGDFLGGAATDTNRGALASMLGPVASLVEEAGSLTAGNAIQALGNRPTNAGQEAVRLVKGLTPGANLWYTKAATDHYIFNWLQNELNPGYLQRSQDRARKEFGQSYWWRPADPTPQRAPNLGAITGRQ